jgi:acetyl esterase/lipase
VVKRKLADKTVLVLLLFLVRIAWADSWTPPKGLEQIPIWPKGAKVLSNGKLSPEELKKTKFVSNVLIPTYTVFRPEINKGGAALVVFPGGGHTVLAMEIEGTEICERFRKAGITCVLVKYRVPYAGCYYDKKLNKHVTPPVPMALQDAQRVISTIRHDAAKYDINPRRIGVMGFSAGGNVTILSSTRFKDRAYERIDKIDEVSCRPDFAIPVYPGHTTMEHKNKTPRWVAAQELNTDIPMSQDIPPTLVFHCEDDTVNPVHYSEVYVRELKKAGISVKFKRYKRGGHAFGVRAGGVDSDRWVEASIRWMKGIGVLSS